MIVCLDLLPYRMAYDIVNWCIENGVELERCEAYLTNDSKYANIEWVVDIPEKQLTFFLLKWNVS